MEWGAGLADVVSMSLGSTEPSDGRSRQVTSLCHVFSRPRLLRSWVMARTSG